MSTMKKSHLFYLTLIVLLDFGRVSAQTTRPDAERKLAHDIYRNLSKSSLASPRALLLPLPRLLQLVCAPRASQNPISSLAARFQRSPISSFVITTPEPSNQCSLSPRLFSMKPNEKQVHRHLPN